MSTIAPVEEPSEAPAEAGIAVVDTRDQRAERTSWISLPAGIVASLLCHAVLVLWALGIFDGAKPLAAAPPQAITVDLMSSEEADQPIPDKPPPTKPSEPEKPTFNMGATAQRPMPPDQRAMPPPTPNPDVVPDTASSTE